MNLLVQPLPQSDKFGRAINTDFRAWVNYSRILDDQTLDPATQVVYAIQSVYDNIDPDKIVEYRDGAGAFINGWLADTPRRPGRASNERIIDYDIDAGDIIVSFQQQYGIRLLSEFFHWFEFMTLLAGLSQDTPMGSKMHYRAMIIDPTLPAADKKRLHEIKKSVRIGSVRAQEQAMTEEEFIKAAMEQAARKNAGESK